MLLSPSVGLTPCQLLLTYCHNKPFYWYGHPHFPDEKHGLEGGSRRTQAPVILNSPALVLPLPLPPATPSPGGQTKH